MWVGTTILGMGVIFFQTNLEVVYSKVITDKFEEVRMNDANRESRVYARITREQRSNNTIQYIQFITLVRKGRSKPRSLFGRLPDLRELEQVSRASYWR